MRVSTWTVRLACIDESKKKKGRLRSNCNRGLLSSFWLTSYMHALSSLQHTRARVRAHKNLDTQFHNALLLEQWILTMPFPLLFPLFHSFLSNFDCDSSSQTLFSLRALFQNFSFDVNFTKSISRFNQRKSKTSIFIGLWTQRIICLPWFAPRVCMSL